MIAIKVNASGENKKIETDTGGSLLEMLRKNGFRVYAPCGGRGTCGKCKVTVRGKGDLLACSYFPERDTDVILPGTSEAAILVNQTEYLEDVPFTGAGSSFSKRPCGVAVDLGTTTIVFYFVNLLSGRIEKIASMLNPQGVYGADVIARINHCMEHGTGLAELQGSVLAAFDDTIGAFASEAKIGPDDVVKVVVAGNTTMLHILLGTDPVSIALAPFTPKFTAKQVRKGAETGLHVNADCELVTLPCLSAYVGADIMAGLAALKSTQGKYLFLDIGTNGEIALVDGNAIFACAAAAGPAFEGAGISCGMGAVEGAISVFTNPGEYRVIGDTEPRGICGSGIIDVVAYLLDAGIVDATGLLSEETFVVHRGNNIAVTRKDIREVQLAKSAIYTGIVILMQRAGLSFGDIDALYLAGGFGNYIDISSAIRIGLLPRELEKRIHPVGNSAGIGALDYLKSADFGKKIDTVVKNSTYVELSAVEDFAMQFAMNMRFE